MQLPQIEAHNKSLEQCLLDRQSIRSFNGRELTSKELGQLCWAAQGTSAHGKRTAPSAGGTFPIELRVLTNSGVYRYLPEQHVLERLTDHDIREALTAACYGQQCMAQASIHMVICAQPDKIVPHYGERSRRYIDIEAGHIAQNIHLEAVALGLGSVAVGAFSDNQANVAMNLLSDMYVVYIVPVGEPSKSSED